MNNVADDPLDQREGPVCFLHGEILASTPDDWLGWGHMVYPG
jgi:hypothetical protein